MGRSLAGNQCSSQDQRWQLSDLNVLRSDDQDL
jgi:hypothetical protein